MASPNTKPRCGMPNHSDSGRAGDKGEAKPVDEPDHQFTHDDTARIACW